MCRGCQAPSRPPPAPASPLTQTPPLRWSLRRQMISCCGEELYICHLNGGYHVLFSSWDDHHKSFFELAEDLCHQEQFIDVTISCGEHNFPAHKLILSVCSPYFKNLFLRNPCKHPIIVLKDVPFKYMKLLLIFMYRGEVAVPQEDLSGLLKTARSLQVRGLSEMQSTVPAAISPRKRYLSDIIQDSDLESRDGEGFSLDEVKTRLCGQLEIQAVRGGGRGSPSSAGSVGTPPLHSWFSERVKYLPATSSHMDEVSTGLRSSRSESGPSEDEPSSQVRSFSLLNVLEDSNVNLFRSSESLTSALVTIAPTILVTSGICPKNIPKRLGTWGLTPLWRTTMCCSVKSSSPSRVRSGTLKGRL